MFVVYRAYFICFYLLLLLLIESVCCFYFFVKVRENKLEDNAEIVHFYYLVHHDTAKLIPDLNTLTLLGADPNKVPEISHMMFKEYRKGPAVPKMAQKDHSPDEILRVELEKNKILQGRLIQNITYIGEYINPSVTPFCGRLFLSVGLAWGFIEGRTANEHLEFRWLNHSLIPYYQNGLYYGVDTKIGMLDVPIVGQDPRMITREDDPNILHVVFTYRYSMPISMGHAVITCNHTTKMVNVTHKTTTLKYYDSPYNDQKNWSPFIYKKKLFMIQQVNPLTVVEPIELEGKEAYAQTFSSSPKVDLDWNRGELRGGTNAIFLGDKYLAFFHSAMTLPNNFLRTYFIGAYTFSAEPPFRLIAVSQQPIMDEAFYTGYWNPLKNRKIDYVPFPSTCFLDGETIVFSLGYQDHAGFMMTLKLKQVLQTLKPVNWSLNNTNHHHNLSTSENISLKRYTRTRLRKF